MSNDKTKNKPLGRILLADDEDTFLRSTAELLRKENYLCDCVINGEQTIKTIQENDYDILISDIKMPGNTDLEMISEIIKIAPNVQLILITGYPTQKSAIDAINMPVAAYLLKPLDFAELLNNVSMAMKKCMLKKTIVRTKQSLKQWLSEIENLESGLEATKLEISNVILKSYLDITTARISATFNEIRSITKIFETPIDNEPICNMMHCSELNELTDAIKEAIEHIKTTKDTHRSKRLGQLRTKLEKLEKNITKI